MDSRTAFEAYIRNAFQAVAPEWLPKYTQRGGDGQYALAEVRRYWDFWQAACALERERCAQICDGFASIEGIAQRCAAAIRKGE